jgi:hypothetical protein
MFQEVILGNGYEDNTYKALVTIMFKNRRLRAEREDKRLKLSCADKRPLK